MRDDEGLIDVVRRNNLLGEAPEGVTPQNAK
jgi:hypothetical protein